MKFRKSIEIGVMIYGAKPFLPHLQVGQHVTVDGNPGRWVGLSPAGVVYIVWPGTVGKSRVNWAIKTMYEAFQRNHRKGK
jgi:hypothetical protein